MDADDLDALFQSEYSSFEPKSNDAGEKFAEKIEAEYRNVKHEETPEDESRSDEKSKITKQIQTLKIAISKCLNIKNPRKTEMNSKLATKRAEFRRQISILEVRLNEIKTEEKAPE